LQSGSKFSSSNFQYPSQKGRLRSKSEIPNFQKKDFIWKIGRMEDWQGETGYGRARSPSRPQAGLSSRNAAARRPQPSRSVIASKALIGSLHPSNLPN
jgi:hypothetical protein